MDDLAVFFSGQHALRRNVRNEVGTVSWALETSCNLGLSLVGGPPPDLLLVTIFLFGGGPQNKTHPFGITAWSGNQMRFFQRHALGSV